MKNTWRIGIGVGSMLGLAALPAWGSGRLQARVIDDVTGQPLAARVAVTDPNGKFVDVQGDHPHVHYLGKRWCYVDGSFAVNLPASGVVLEIRRGLETLPVSATFTNDIASKTIEKTFRLRRWIDMRRKGYLEGDIHAHLPVPKEAHFQMRAEDLNALTLLYLPDTGQPIPVNGCFTRKLDAHSTPGCEIYVGQEIQDFQWGT